MVTVKDVKEVRTHRRLVSVEGAPDMPTAVGTFRPQQIRITYLGGKLHKIVLSGHRVLYHGQLGSITERQYLADSGELENLPEWVDHVLDSLEDSARDGTRRVRLVFDVPVHMSDAEAEDLLSGLVNNEFAPHEAVRLEIGDWSVWGELVSTSVDKVPA